MQRAIVVALGLFLVACATTIPDVNTRPAKYYQETVRLTGRIARLQDLPGEVLLEIVDAREHRLLVRAPSPVEARPDEWVKVSGIFVPETRVGGRIVYDIVLADSVTRVRAPWLRNLF